MVILVPRQGSANSLFLGKQSVSNQVVNKGGFAMAQLVIREVVLAFFGTTHLFLVATLTCKCL